VPKKVDVAALPDSVVRERIVVVDDDEQGRRMLTGLMVAAGFECANAGSLREAREELRRRDADLVLLDIHLQGESGLSLARELSGRHQGPAVIMVSGADDAEVAGIALDAGVYGYVTKPFKRNEVTIAVQNALRRRRLESESREHRAMLEDRVVERTAEVHDALSRLRLANEETVLRLSKAVEFRDPETGSHIERMSHYCGLLAGRFGLDPDGVRVASRLHDVGKIAVPDSILQKPGPLTPEERREMERHASIGHRLLRGSRSELLEFAAEIAWTHHERFDGTGYPRGLAGADIPLAGRIAGVADVFDALTTDRVYRGAIPLEEAVATLRAERGRHFDPEVVDAFVAELDEVRSIMARFDDDASSEQAAQGEGAAPAELVTLQEAAATAGVSPSTMRRWADEGRVHAVRTAGGHRRFPLDAVRSVAADRGARPTIRPVAPAAEPLLSLAERLRAQGPEAVGMAAASLYRGSTPGWFAGDAAAEATGEWLPELIRACETGRYAGALEATSLLMRRAYLQGTTLLERHTFLDRLGEVAVRSLSQAGASRGDLGGTRRLFTALQQSLLDGLA
jgi:putative two-component system response regulator